MSSISSSVSGMSMVVLTMHAIEGSRSGSPQVSGCHSRQTVVTTGHEQVGEQHVNIFIQVNTQARGVDRHWTCPVAGSTRPAP